MIKFLSKFFQNNGHVRGALYFSAAALSGVTNAFTHWAEAPPRNGYEIVAEFLGAFAAGLIAVRAYLDTHLSRPKNEIVENPASSNQPR